MTDQLTKAKDSLPFAIHRTVAENGTRLVHIEASADRNYRRAMLAAAGSRGQKVRWRIRRVLDHGPSRGASTGPEEAMRYFGAELQTVLLRTAPIIDAIEIGAPGFKNWLVLTGFGNDLSMIKALVAWAEHDETTRGLVSVTALAHKG